ncbi:major tail protein [Eubacterium multiforme]|uniref:Phi13 family phage major tail protein n=1 Tax=Eubacterium multiforme TaxID=83339 RepID=A0ABT9US43_9FIRM|nr:major tail protein [Eubacterium multiforme]MDQ0149124.1 phi13 family phage major tail protein [Eubacterium multiforme]
MPEARKKMGCKNCMIAFRNEDESNGITFIAPEKLKDLEELQYNYTYAEGVNYADNIQNIYLKKPTGAEIQLTFSNISSKMLAKIMGKKYNKGGYSTNANEKAVPVAILFQETYSDGSFINTVFYNVKLARDESTAKSSGENFDFTPIVLKGKAIPFNNKKAIDEISFVMDSAETDVDKTKLYKFFTEVVYAADEDIA